MLRLRPYEPDDWPAVCALYDAAKPDELAGVADRSQVTPLAGDAAMTALFRASDVAVATLSGRIAGFAGRRASFVSWLFVHPDFRRMGVATALLRDLLARAARPVTLNVLAANATAHALYARFGFVVEREFEGRFAGRHGSVPCKVCRLRLDGGVTVLSAGAVAEGLEATLRDFEADGRPRVAVRFDTAPRMRERLAAGERFDLVIAPPELLDAFVAPVTRVEVGRVGAGIVVHADAPLPVVDDVPSLAAALTGAAAVVLNRASTGLHLEALFRHWGLWDAIAHKVARYADAAAVIERVAAGRAGELGFAPVTEILPWVGHGVRYAGALPRDAQRPTSYVAALTSRGEASPRARELAAFLATAASRERFRASGVE